MLLGLLGFWVSYHDILYGKISNVSLIALGVLLLSFFLAGQLPWVSHLTAGIIGVGLTGLLYLFYDKRHSIGAGDLKLFAISCFFTDLSTLPFFIMGAGFLGLLVSILYRHFFYKTSFPLGPSLIGSLLGTLIYKTLPL